MKQIEPRIFLLKATKSSEIIYDFFLLRLIFIYNVLYFDIIALLWFILRKQLYNIEKGMRKYFYNTGINGFDASTWNLQLL